MNEFLTSNGWQWRLARTAAQGVLAVAVANLDLLAVAVANLDLLVGVVAMDPAWRALCVALVMAVLSPVMAELGAACGEGGGDE